MNKEDLVKILWKPQRISLKRRRENADSITVTIMKCNKIEISVSKRKQNSMESIQKQI